MHIFLEVIKDHAPHISEQALWGLGNISADCIKFRDLILQKGGMELVLKAMEETDRSSFLKQGVWAVTNMMGSSPKPKYNLIKAAIPVLGNLVVSGVLGEDEIASSLWSIYAHTESQKTRIQQLVEIKGFIPNLFDRYWKGASEKILIPLLKVLGNLSVGNELHT